MSAFLRCASVVMVLLCVCVANAQEKTGPEAQAAIQSAQSVSMSAYTTDVQADSAWTNTATSLAQSQDHYENTWKPQHGQSAAIENAHAAAETELTGIQETGYQSHRNDAEFDFIWGDAWLSSAQMEYSIGNFTTAYNEAVTAEGYYNDANFKFGLCLGDCSQAQSFVDSANNLMGL